MYYPPQNSGRQRGDIEQVTMDRQILAIKTRSLVPRTTRRQDLQISWTKRDFRLPPRSIW